MGSERLMRSFTSTSSGAWVPLCVKVARCGVGACLFLDVFAALGRPMLDWSLPTLGHGRPEVGPKVAALFFFWIQQRFSIPYSRSSFYHTYIYVLLELQVT